MFLFYNLVNAKNKILLLLQKIFIDLSIFHA